MAGEKAQEGPKPVDVGLERTRELVGKHLVPNEATVRHRESLGKLAAQRAAKERKVKLDEGMGLPELVSLVAAKKEGEQGLPPDDESCCLTNDERLAYCEVVDQCVDQETTNKDEKEALRQSMAELIFQPKVFRQRYHEWQEQWSSDKKLQSKFPDFKDYVFEGAKAYIASHRDRWIASRLRRFNGVSAENAEKDDHLQEIIKKTIKFVRENEESLLEYTKLQPDDPKRKELFQKFLAVAQIPADKIGEARKLFDEIINDIELAFAAQKELEVCHEEMIAMADDDTISDDEWKNRLEKVKKKSNILPEAVVQQPGPVYGNVYTEVGSTGPSLDTVTDVALQSGGLMVKPPATPPDYTFISPSNPGFEVSVTIIPKKGSKDYNDATFIFHDKHDKTDTTISKENLKRETNKLFLSYLINDWFVISTGLAPAPNVKETLTSDIMVRMTQNLLGRNLNEVVLSSETDNKADVKSGIKPLMINFLSILMKDDPQIPSLEDRVKKMDLVLMSPIYAGKLKRMFEMKSSNAYVLHTLLQDPQVDYRG